MNHSPKIYHILLLSTIILAIIIRLFGITQPFNEDELHWAYSTEVRDWFGTVMRNSPLSIYVMNAFTAIFGVNPITLRLPFIIVGILTILMTAKLALEQHGKRTSILAAFFLAIHPLHILASLQATYEGSFLAFFFITTLFFLSRYQRRYSAIYLYFAGIAFGLSMLTKTAALLLIPPIAFFFLYTVHQRLFLALKQTSLIFLIGLALFILGFAIPSILIQSPAFVNVITQLLSQKDLPRINSFFILFQYAYALLWLGPLFLFLPFYSIFKQHTDRLHAVSIIYVILFYFIAIRESSPPLERYWMILLPSFAIMSARTTLSILKPTFLNLYAILTSLALTFSFLFITHLMPAKMIPFYPKINYLSALFSFDWNFLVPITGSSGPLGFYLHFLPFTIIFIIEAVLFLIICFVSTKNKTRFPSILFTLLLGMSLGYALFFDQEYLFSATGPNISDVTRQVITYVNSNNLPLPIYYFRNYALFYHFDNYTPPSPSLPPFDYFNHASYQPPHLQELRTHATQQPFTPYFVPLSFVDDAVEKSNHLLKELKQKGGSIIFIDFPYLSKEGALWQTIQQCKRLTQFHTKGPTTGYIFDCNNLVTKK